MKRVFFVSALVALFALLAMVEDRAVAQSPTAAADPHSALVNKYCVGCHSSRGKAGGLVLEGRNLKTPAADADVWEKAVRKLRGHLMPPPGAPQPPLTDSEGFVAWMENELDTHATGPKAGYVPIERLNRTEYVAAIKDLVGVDVNEKEVLPRDIEVEGFDNVAAALSVSPAFLDQFITSARKVAKLAIGDMNKVGNVKYSIAANQDPALPLPLGTRGGIRFKHNFPADGEYRININSLSLGLYTGTVENESTLVILIDGKPVFRNSIGGKEDQALADRKGADGRALIMERFSKIPVQVKAGVRDVVVAFIDRSNVETDENWASVAGGRMARLADGVELTGPFNPTGISTTPSRAPIFVCDPKEIGEPACAKKITETIARRAYRRPVNDKDMARLMPFYEAGRKNGGSFDQGVEQVVAAVLASPDFLYREIRGTPKADRTKEFALSDLELASRLSFFLWNTGPDEELLTLAAANGLSKAGAMEKQVKRMLADPKASSLVSSFAMKWLNLDDLDSVKPDPAIFRGFNDQMRRDFAKEVELFLTSVMLENRSVVDLLTADYTFLNERVARHYGIRGVYGDQFRRVTLTNQERFGLLGKAAVLMRTSYGDRTSPVLRGAWVLDKIQGTPPAPPPPNVTTNIDNKAGEAPKTVRARLEFHRDKPVCRQCHGVIDPTGLALEKFDAIGAFRTIDREANQPIDAATVLPSGIPIDGPVELRKYLADHSQMFVQAMTEKLMMYALNRELQYFDMPQVRAIVRNVAKEDNTLESIVLGIASSDTFRRQAPEPAKPAEKAAEKPAGSAAAAAF